MFAVRCVYSSWSFVFACTSAFMLLRGGWGWGSNTDLYLVQDS
jgi:hypothetical protein